MTSLIGRARRLTGWARNRGVPSPPHSERNALACSAAIGAIGALHRLGLLAYHRDALRELVFANPEWLTWQYLTIPALRDHFWLSIGYLQQTPPIPHLILGGFVHAFGWPLGTAWACIALQGCITVATAVLLFQTLRLLTGQCATPFVLALVFLLSIDLIALEYNSFGQTFYENLAMLLIVALVHACIRAGRNPSDRAVLVVGGLTAILALTRATYSYFAVVPLAFLLATRASPRHVMLFLCPVLLLHGGWSLKNFVVYGVPSVSTSSWKGMNFASGLVKAGQGLELRDSILAEPNAYPAYFVEMIREHGIVRWHPPIYQDYMPPSVQRRDDEIQRALGGTNRSQNSVGQRVVADLYMTAYLRYLARNPVAVAEKFAVAYDIFWQPIRNYGERFVAPFFVNPTVRHGLRPERAIAGLISGRIPQPPRMMIGTYGHELPRQSRPTHIFAVPYLPTLVWIANVVTIHVGVPLLLLAYLRGVRSGVKVPSSEYALLVAVFAYAALVCNLPDLWENMRFRLAVEPVIWILTAVTLVELRARWVRWRGGAANAGP